MEFKFIDTVIDNISIDLEILTKDSNLYTSLLFQHIGTFNTSAVKFGNQLDCTNKFNHFLTLAKSKNVSLAMTPEYSCPWSSIEWLLDDQNNWPNNSKLWAICCESITPDELKAFRQKYNTTDFRIHFNESDLNNGGGVLLDPLCYIFKAKENNVEKLVVLIQFKTQHMGVWESNAEQAKYIWGTHIYVLRNSTNSIFLFANICSEAANFSVTEKMQQELESRWEENPYIILSPQMNPKPSHDTFKNFRRTILNYTKKDIISLNWGGGTMFTGKSNVLIPFSKSAIFFKTDVIDFDNESKFISNHKRGLYYILKKPNIHIYYLNPCVEVFLISNKKPSSAGTNASMVRRDGPNGESNFQWSGSEFTELQIIEDGFMGFLDTLNCNNAVFRNVSISVIDKERLINVSSGKVKVKSSDKRWFTIDKLETFQQSDDESVKRLTYIHDESGLEQREKYIDIIDVLNAEILQNQSDHFPENLSPFINNCTEVMFPNEDGYNYKYNLSSNSGDRHATIAYIGRKDEDSALKILEQMQNIFDKGDQSRKLVVVWYKANATVIKSVSDPLPPKVTDDSSTESNSIIS